MSLWLPTLLVAAGGLFVFDVLSWLPAVLPTLCIGLGFGFTATKLDRHVAATRLDVGALLLFSLVYGIGTTLWTNMLLDDTPVKSYRTEVLAKRASGSDDQDYELDLSPWGPQKTPRTATVHEGTYESVSKGGTVCVGLREGGLWIPWFGVVKCR